MSIFNIFRRKKKTEAETTHAKNDGFTPRELIEVLTKSIDENPELADRPIRFIQGLQWTTNHHLASDIRVVKPMRMCDEQLSRGLFTTSPATSVHGLEKEPRLTFSDMDLIQK